MPPSLPPELTDHIIDHLQPAPKSLKACSLVCSAWRPRAQHHIFEREVLISQPKYDVYQKLIEESPRSCRHIRALGITQPPETLTTGGDPRFLQFMHAVPLVSDTFSRVTRLALRCVHIGTLHRSENFKLDTVTELHLQTILTPYLTTLAEFICSFPNLAKLTVLKLHVAADFSRSPVPGQNLIAPCNPLLSKPAIKSLRFRGGFLRTSNHILLTAWLFSESMLASLTELEIDIQHEADISVLAEVLKACGPQLRKLYLDVNLVDINEDLCDRLTLRHCSSLRTLSFNSLHMASQGEGVIIRNLKWVSKALEVNSPHIEDIHFKIHAGGAVAEDMGRLNWKEVGETLCAERFNTLRRVEFLVCRGQTWRDKIITYIKAQVPGLEARGITDYRHIEE
ncbi:predicted protein [Postia placenta Mad-698-R]|uniref:F-box domain-containing protein n=1 Tax=Postia placenta MAD-698-R-SB12 TaxID=670580 RepID=A0A1X6NCU9_9APHY|nr:hypothetical protein POSPLADRAFT_1031476 [Postia placenta MAD-698-R-SB12]EED81674.1 predicted protein [Postia placenta Mad-698-R]OSX66467.1 hypothetical protein POSPLADRAFT_1031476 [Postia placenta MAD-698-R-SB12]